MSEYQICLLAAVFLFVIYLFFFGKKGGFLILTFHLRQFKHPVRIQNAFVILSILFYAAAFFLDSGGYITSQTANFIVLSSVPFLWLIVLLAAAVKKLVGAKR